MSSRPFRVGRSRTGLGLFATKPITKGQFLAYYRGPKITAAESEKREARGNRYLYEINSRWVIDGSPRYNVARYGNHSCRPNAETDTKGHKVFVRAIKNIEPGEEITYDYGKNYFDIYLRPIGCKCLHCIAKRRKERSAKIAETKRLKALEARKAARATSNGVKSGVAAADTSAAMPISLTATAVADKKSALPKGSKTKAKASKVKAAGTKAAKAKGVKAKAKKTETKKTKAAKSRTAKSRAAPKVSVKAKAKSTKTKGTKAKAKSRAKAKRKA